MQLAWNKLKNQVVKEPILVQGAEDLCKRLNEAKQTDADLPPETFYAAAGRGQDGIIERIQVEMKKRFPKEPAPDFPRSGLAFLAYAFLQAEARFTIPFFDNGEPLPFKDSQGKTSNVRAFGIRSKDDYAYQKLRNQVAVLYAGSAKKDYFDGFKSRGFKPWRWRRS